MAFATFHRGKQLCYDGDLTEGLKLVEEALRRRPREILFLSYKSQFLYESRKYKEAVACAETVLKVKSKDAKVSIIIQIESTKYVCNDCTVLFVILLG